MRVLVTGGSGFIGYNFIKTLIEKVEVFSTYYKNSFLLEGISSHHLDVRNRSNVLNLILVIKPDITIHTVAVHGMDLCETDKNFADIINIEGTRNVVDACKKINSRIIYISTSAVFNGVKKSYYEDDNPDPVNYHGFTHLEGEKIVTNSNLPFLIFRADHPYGWVRNWQKKNSAVNIIEKLINGEVVKEVVDWYNTPTYVTNFVDVAIKLITKEDVGIYHIVGPDFVSRYEFALKIAKVMKKDQSLVQPMNSDELKLPAKRGYNKLDNKKAENDSGVKLLSVEEGIKSMLKEGNIG